MQIEVEVKGQRIKRINSPGSVEDTLNYLTCYFTFDGEEWDNTVKTAYFRNPASGKTYSQILAEDNTCTVPWEALTDWGFVKFSVSGERENYRITTDIESFYNGETVYGGEPSEPPTPDQYDQMIALAEQTKEIAESVRRDADEGKFDGDPGEPGKPGAPGRDGVSPTAKVEQTDDGAVITVTDATGTTTAKLKNGKDGDPGQDATDEQVQAAVDAYIEEHPIQGDTEDIIKLAIKNEASGEVPVVIADSAEMGVQDIKMQGWTEQDSTEGKNLFDLNGVEYSKMINVLNGTISDNDGYSVSPYIPVKPNTIYSRTYNSIHGNVLYDSEKQYISDVAGGSTIRTTENAAYLRFNLPNNVSYAEATIVNEGSTLLPYEPYTGGAPSPSPDYPQEIVSAGKYNEDTQKWDYEVKLTGANLFDYTDMLFDDGYIHSNYLVARSIKPFHVEEGKQYILVQKGYQVVSNDYSSVYFGEDDLSYFGNADYDTRVLSSGISYVGFIGGVEKRKLLTALRTCEITKCMVHGGSNNERYQVEEFGLLEYAGDINAPYEPYRTPQTVTLTSDRPLTKWDKLEKRNGQWGWVYKSAEVVLDGSEDEVWNSTTIQGCFRFLNYTGNQKSHECFSDKLINYVGSVNSIPYNTILVSTSAMWIRLSDVSTMEEFKIFLSSNPITVYYETAEETFAPLSESEQEQMNALHTYYPTTVLSNDTECEMSIKYIADTKTYIDSKIAAIQAAVVNTI